MEKNMEHEMEISGNKGMAEKKAVVGTYWGCITHIWGRTEIHMGKYRVQVHEAFSRKLEVEINPEP